MRRIILLTALFLVNDVASAASTAFLNVNVIAMTEDRVVEAQTVIVEDGVITVIGDVDGVPVPKDAVVVDGTDRYLMPGLVEMHAHVAEVGSPELERDLTLFIANGVTTVRGMLGRPSHLASAIARRRGVWSAASHLGPFIER